MSHFTSGHSSVLSSNPRSSPARSVFTDGSFAIRGAQQLSAVKRGLAESMQVAQRDGIFDMTVRLRFPRFHDFLVGCDSLERVPFFTSAPDVERANLLTRQLRYAHFEPNITRRIPGRREKGVDLAIGLAVLDGTQSLGEGAVVTLVMGDADFMPIIDRLQQRGICIDIVGWEHATSEGLIGRARKFIPLDPHFHTLCFNTGTC